MTHAALLFVAFVLLGAGRAGAADPPMPLNPERVAEISAVLPAHTTALGAPIGDRTAWDGLREHPAFAEVIPDAEALLKTAIPEKTEELFMDFFETGVRRNWERVDSQWRRRLTTLFLAECLENQGRFLPGLEEMVVLFLEEPTWMMPAHRPAREAYYGEAMDIDLKAADVAHTLALIAVTLGDRLDGALQARIRTEMERRIFKPFRDKVTGEEPHSWWLMGTNNWNAVCLAGVTGAALALLEDREDRAFFINAAETYSQNFLAGFTPDGYCSEGVGYWGYGYGHYLLLCEVVHRATEGKVDLLLREGGRGPARYAGLVEIQDGVYPPFADCSVSARPSEDFMYYVNRRFGLGFSEWDDVDTTGVKSHLALTFMFSFPTTANGIAPVASAGPRLEARTWFPDAGVLICRPGGAATPMAVALKGGNNAEHHNHNDVGSYLVVVGGEAVLADPGAEVYTQRTFSSRRYESNVLNSYGHPVPRVAGQLQRPGRDAKGVVLSSDFTDAADVLTLDLASAYNVPTLTKLERSFHYDRAGDGSFTVTDVVAFETPETFETALVTLGGWTRLDEDTLLFQGLDEAVRVELAVEGGAFALADEVIDEDVRTRTKPTRVAIRFTDPVKEARVTMTIAPERGGEADELRNGDFDLGSLGWRAADGIASIGPEEVAGGQALRIRDTSTGKGSNVLSGKVVAAPGAAMALTGRHYPVSGAGLGLYVRYYDGADQLLNGSDGRGNHAPVGVLDGDGKAWAPFSFPFETPPDTAYVRVWVHSMNGAEVEALLDDLAVTAR